jgi:hypothetical protein
MYGTVQAALQWFKMLVKKLLTWSIDRDEVLHSFTGQ